MDDIEVLQERFEKLGISCGYWTKRGVPDEWILKYRLGFDAKKGYATIPFYYGERLIGIAGRYVGDNCHITAKFISYGFSRKDNLYFPQGIWPQADCEILIVEGSLDAIKCRELGSKNVVGIYSLCPSEAQVDYLRYFRPKKLIFLLDSDTWGYQAKERVQQRMYMFFDAVEFIYCPADGVDPWEYKELGEFLKEQGLCNT